MSAEPLRHYFVGDVDTLRACKRDGCGREPGDSVHLTPGDDPARDDAIRAASPHPTEQRTHEQSEAAIARAAKRTARRRSRDTLGALRDRPPREAG